MDENAERKMAAGKEDKRGREGAKEQIRSYSYI